LHTTKAGQPTTVECLPAQSWRSPLSDVIVRIAFPSS
jgi:hypothetical protein